MKLLATVSVAVALSGAHFRGSHFRGTQPFRCATSVCKPFDSDCGGNSECVTDKCYEGKCGMGATCSPAQTVCFTDSPHTCCTGVCQAVIVRSDCMKLLNLDHGSSVLAHEGVNVDRQCDRVGICEHWPGKAKGPGILTTPWAVDPGDNVAKYYALAGLTFKAGTQIDVARVVSRRVGRIREGVNPAKTRPRAVNDAGILKFVPGSFVMRDIVMAYEFGDQLYCIAPILLNGEGGGYFAVGIDCCTKTEFQCGDHNGTAGIVINSELTNFGQAHINLETEQGPKYHREGFGIKTDAPMFVQWTWNPEEKRSNPSDPRITYVQDNTNRTFCTAPIGIGVEPVGFVAVGDNCCDDHSFSCGPADNPDASSGALVTDLTGDYINALKQGEFAYGYSTAPKPIFLAWTAEVLVPSP